MANSAFTPLILDDKLPPEEKIKRAQKWLQENKYNYNLITQAYSMPTRPPEVEPYLENIKKDIETYKNVQSAVSQYHNELNAIKAENALKVKAYNDQITTAVEQKRSMEFGRLAKPEKTVYYTDKNGAITRYEEWIKARPEDYTFGAELPKNARIVSHGKNKYVVRTYTIDELGKEINRLSEEQKTRLKTYQNTIGYYSMKEWTPFKNTSPIGRTANALLSEVNKTLVGTALSLTENVATASLVLKNHADLQRQFVNDLVSGKIRDFNDAIGQYGKTWSQAVKLSKIDFPRFALTGSPAVDYLQFTKTHPTSPEGIPQEISMAEEVVQSVARMLSDIALVSGTLKAADIAKIPSIAEGTTKMVSLSYAKRFGGTLAALDAIKTYNSLTGDTLMKKGGMDALDIANAALKTAVSAGLTYALFAIPPVSAVSKTPAELTEKQIQAKIMNYGKDLMKNAFKGMVLTTPLKLMTLNTINIIANYGVDIATGKSTSKTVNEMGAEVLGQVLESLPKSYFTGFALGAIGVIKAGITAEKVNKVINNIYKEYEKWQEPYTYTKTSHDEFMKSMSQVLVKIMDYVREGDITSAQETLNAFWGKNPLKPETYSKLDRFILELSKGNIKNARLAIIEVIPELNELGDYGRNILNQLLNIQGLFITGDHANALSLWNALYQQLHPVEFNKTMALKYSTILQMLNSNKVIKKKLTPEQRKAYAEELQAMAYLSYINDILGVYKQPTVVVSTEDINKSNITKVTTEPRMKDVMEPEGTETKPTEGVPIVKVSPETKPPTLPETTTKIKTTAEQPPVIQSTVMPTETKPIVKTTETTKPIPTTTTATISTEAPPTEETPEELESNRQLEAVERMIAEKRKEKGLPPKPPTKEPVKPQVSIEKPEVKPEVKSEAKPTISANIPVSSARKLSPEEKNRTNRAFHKVLRDATGGDKEMMKYVKAEIINDITSATRKGEPPVNRMVDMTEEEWGVLNKLLSDDKGRLNPIEINEDMHNLLEKNKQKYLKLQEEGGKLNAEEGRARDTEITPQGAPELERGKGQEHDLRYNAGEGNMAPQEGEKKEEVEVKKAPAVGNIDEIVERVEPEKTNVIPEENIGKEKKVYKKNKELKIKYALVPLDKVITSHDTDFNPNPEYPQELQNRDRSKTQLKLDTIEKVNKFIPSLYMENEVASDGRPIVVIDKNGRVITLTGNGRLIALKMKAEKEGGLTEYEKELKSRLPEFGLKDQDVKGKVLVGVYYGKDNLVDLARLLNEPETKELSKIEQAVSDAVLLANAKKKGRDVLAKLNEDVSNILSPKNSQFLQLFTEICVGDEAKVRAESGEYTHDFQERVENALFMYIFNNDNRAKSLLSAYREAGETRIKALLNGVMLNLPLISKLRDLIDTYHCMDLDMTPELLGALYDINEIRKSGEKIEDLLYATDIFSEDHIRIPDYKIPLYRALVSIKSNNQAKLFIGGYYSSAMDTLDPHQQTLFSNLPTSRKEFITEYAKEWLETYGKKTYEEAKTAIAKTAVSQEVVGAGKERPPEKVEQKGKAVAKPIKRTVKPVSLEGLKGKRLYQASIHNVLANGGLKRKQIDATIKIIDDVLRTFTKLTDAGTITDENYGDWVSTIVYYPEAPEFNPLTKTKQGEVVKGFFFNIDETGKAGMVFGKNMDVSTMPHEFSHSYELLMQKGAEVSPKVKNMYNLFSHWLGVKPGNWTKEAKEKFANAFMHCLHEGLYRDGEIGEAYEIMEKSLKAIWKDVKDVEELEIPDYIRDLYNIIFGTKTYEQVFDNEIRDLIKKETQFIPENATRGSPFRAPHFKIKPVNKSTSIVEYTPKTKGYTTTTFMVKKIDGGYIVDGIVCRTPEDIQRRLAELVRDNRDVFDYRKVFQSNDAEVNKRLNDAEKQQKQILKQLKDDLNALYASVTKSKLNLDSIRTALTSVIEDFIMRDYGIDPTTPDGHKRYQYIVKNYTGQTSLSKASTFELINLLNEFEPGMKDVVFGSDFFKVLPEVVRGAQEYLEGEYDEEAILRAIFTGVFEYPSSKNNRSIQPLYWTRATNALIATMGKAGLEVINYASEARKWREAMLYNGMRIIYEMKRIFNNYQNCNANQAPYGKGAQRNVWRIIIDAIEKVDPNLEGDAKLQAQYKMIEKKVEDNNEKASFNAKGYYVINLEDVKKIFELTKEFTDYFGQQIDQLNNRVGEIVIGKQPNYIIRSIVNAKSKDWGLNIHPESGRITMDKPPSVLSREEEEEVGIRNLDMIKLFENYVWGMGQYIANYEFVQFANYELPFKVPQNFHWRAYFIPYVKNLLDIGKKPGDIDYLIDQAKTVLVNNALSYNFGMVALNYFQRFLSVLFVDPKVFKASTAKLNPLNAKMSEEDLNKYSNFRELMDILATGGKSIFMESVEEFTKFDPYKSARGWVNTYGKMAKISRKILEKSPFMFFEEGNWRYGYVVGAVQSIVHSNTFKEIYNKLINSGMNKSEAYWQAINDALANPVVFKNALTSAQVVNAAVNVDPSSIFAPLLFGKNNVLTPLLIFWRFTVNMANIFLLDIFNNWSLKNPYSRSYVDLFLHGGEEAKKTTGELKVLYDMRNTFSPSNLKRIFGQLGEEFLGDLNQEEAEKIFNAINDAIKNREKVLKDTDKYAKQLLTGKLTGQRLLEFLGYMAIEFLLTYVYSVLRQAQRKSIGQYLIKPENRKAFLGKVVPKREIRKAVLNSVNIAKMISPKSIGTGIFPEVNIYNTTEWKSIVRALLRWGTTVAIPPLSLVDINLRTATGASLEEIIYYNCIYEKKRK